MMKRVMRLIWLSGLICLFCVLSLDAIDKCSAEGLSQIGFDSEAKEKKAKEEEKKKEKEANGTTVKNKNSDGKNKAAERVRLVNSNNLIEESKANDAAARDAAK